MRPPAPGVVLAFREKDEWLLNWKRERRGFVRSAELLSPRRRARGRPLRPSLSFDCSPTQEIPLSRNGFFGIYSLIISLKYFACDSYSNMFFSHYFCNAILLFVECYVNLPLTYIALFYTNLNMYSVSSILIIVPFIYLAHNLSKLKKKVITVIESNGRGQLSIISVRFRPNIRLKHLRF